MILHSQFLPENHPPKMRTQFSPKLQEFQPFPVSKLERLRAYRQRAVKSQKSSISTVSVARQQAQPAEAVRNRKLFRVAAPPTGVCPSDKLKGVEVVITISVFSARARGGPACPTPQGPATVSRKW